MKIITKLFGPTTSTHTYTPKSEQEAWIAIMYACMHIDGHIADTEIQKMFDVIQKIPLFKRKHIADYYQPALLANRKVGSYNLIDGSIPFIHIKDKALLFELIMKLLLADGKLLKKEKEIAAYLTTALNLEFDIAKKIVDELVTHK